MMKSEDLWFRRSSARGPIQLRLFCFPYAGGTALIYRDWLRDLPATVELIAVELPGRASRLNEQAYVRMAPLVEAIAGLLPPLLDTPFAFFGHSMGALIAFELSRFLFLQQRLQPEVLLVSGRASPQIPNHRLISYNLPEPALIEELHRLQGTPPEVLQHKELMNLMLPLLRADFELVQTYDYVPGDRLRCPVVAFGGTGDREVSSESLSAWAELTDARFALNMLQGDHFFLKESRKSLLALIASELREAIASADRRKTIR